MMMIAQKVQLTRIEYLLTRIKCRLCAFQQAINQGRASPLTSPKSDSDTQICRFRKNFDQKPLKVCY